MTPYYDDGTVTLYAGDCKAVMAAMEPNSIDAIVTDPPYDLTAVSRNGSARKNNPETPFGRHKLQSAGGFMGQRWDGTGVAFRVETWTEAFRVLKPGGRLLAFGGTRTHHRMVCAIEDAGFVIEDTIAWLYGSGFPKHKSKLKPAHEPIVVAWKPDAKATPLNIDTCRIGYQDDGDKASATPQGRATSKPSAGAEPDAGRNMPRIDFDRPALLGRWPANVALGHHDDCVPVGTKRVKASAGGITGKTPGVFYGGWSEQLPRTSYADADGTETVAAWDCHPDCAVALLDAQSGERTAGHHPGQRNGRSMWAETGGGLNGNSGPERWMDSGGASRFFYCAKASRSERGVGNDHPTVKPLSLMRWLVKLVTPPGGLVLDPFAGSGTTLLAARAEGFRAIGCDLSEHNCGIAVSRLSGEAGTGQPGGLRRYGNGKGMGDTVRRCPEHGESFPSGSNHYRCGCPAVRVPPIDVSKPPAVDDLPLFADRVAD